MTYCMQRVKPRTGMEIIYNEYYNNNDKIKKLYENAGIKFKDNAEFCEIYLPIKDKIASILDGPDSYEKRRLTDLTDLNSLKKYWTEFYINEYYKIKSKSENQNNPISSDSLGGKIAEMCNRATNNGIQNDDQLINYINNLIRCNYDYCHLLNHISAIVNAPVQNIEQAVSACNNMAIGANSFSQASKMLNDLAGGLIENSPQGIIDYLGQVIAALQQYTAATR